MDVLRIGTRGSQLALFQANACAALLREHAGVDSEIVVIKTSGDRLAEAPLSAIGGKRLFVKEIEDALLAGDVDVAVHSSKDMPALLPDGLTIAAVLPREDARDAIVLPQSAGGPVPLDTLLARLGSAPRIGTSSVRRTAQLRHLWPNGQFLPIRGNLDTRLRKVDGDEFDAIVLAAAGLNRLQFGARITSAIPADRCVPAPGQGIIAVEVRQDDRNVADIVRRIDDPTTAIALAAERAVVARLGGGCQMPIGAYARVAGDAIDIDAIVSSLDGTRVARAAITSSISHPEAAGRAAAERLLGEGAGAILADVQDAGGPVRGLQP
jgi:hydroxymethylbilane synthase